ncbi:hypothetical protein B0H16DRAFT_1441943 [Mycena metata]|uniref:BTB domain-containing protein n=1 Tax=Mycena metata TaxID=1033252 RepID=A0AAD7GP68_9AGAR|nr:hypothetical protein B0H16DRAFT_1441943 [Mycena metata]
MLSMHSSVFRDMFTLPLPPNNEEMIENCPVVVLSGDTAQDWSLLLEALFPKSYSTELPNLELLAAMLRLGKKYDFPRFREDSVRWLKQDFSSTLEEYDEHDAEFNFKLEDTTSTYLFIASLAREIGLPSLLPLCYAEVVTDYEGEAMKKILDLNDSSVNTIDRLACLAGHHKLLNLQSTTMFAWLDLDMESAHIPTENCRQSIACGAAIKKIFIDISRQHPPPIMILNPWDKDWDASLCSSCRKKAKKLHDTGRETCWEAMPAAFGLPEWAELKSLDFE